MTVDLKRDEKREKGRDGRRGGIERGRGKEGERGGEGEKEKREVSYQPAVLLAIGLFV